jgi:hypothetical protein
MQQMPQMAHEIIMMVKLLEILPVVKRVSGHG